MGRPLGLGSRDGLMPQVLAGVLDTVMAIGKGRVQFDDCRAPATFGVQASKLLGPRASRKCVQLPGVEDKWIVPQIECIDCYRD
jgi:hypothetical protein